MLRLARALSVACAGAFACAAFPVQAEDLLQVYREARNNDPVYASARSALEAGREALPQGRALILPSFSVSYTSAYNDDWYANRAGPTGGQVLGRYFNSNGWNAVLSQPLYRPQNWTQYKEAEFQVAQAEATFAQAGEDLIVRTAQAYFQVLASQDSLAFIRAQKAAISEQLAQAKRNFDVGTATIVDTHDAQARYDLSTSQEIVAEADLEFQRRSLQQLIGRFPGELTPLKPKLTLALPQPQAMESWAEAAQNQNTTVLVQQAAVEVADREVQRNRQAHLPTVDLVTGYNRIGQNNNVVTGIGFDQKAATFGIQLNVPIYSGGLVSSRVRQAQALLEKSRSDLENSRRTAALAARQSYLGVTNGIAQVKALEQALLSSQTALDSNKTGQEVGVRIEIDVLNSQQQVYSTQRDLAAARYNTIMAGLKLKSAAGTLTEADVEEVNRLLGAQ
jgi:outer membrane protein